VSVEPPISVSGLSVAYRLPEHHHSSVKELAIGAVRRQLHWRMLWALRDISFELAPGECLGIIGANGAGKSTLMRVLSRVLPPTHGRVVVRGRVAPMIELGAGFTPQLTGYENLVLYGALLGRDPRDMRRRAQAIAEWAGVSEFLEAPVRTYSQGMQARLAFSVATDTRPDILVIDEVLAVGDASFKRKCVERLAEITSQGTSSVLVSHQTTLLRNACQRLLWLDRGRIVACGETKPVLADYERSMETAAQAGRQIPAGTGSQSAAAG